jgi:hypothetical protein
MDPLILSLVSACTALVASIAGPIVTLAVARRQFNANVLSANRQKWIETLRDMLSEWISILATAAVVRTTWKTEWDGGLAPISARGELLDKVERLVLVQAKIRLLLNPLEADHEELRRAIDAASQRLKAAVWRESETEADVEAVTRLAQAILKREWQRVKRGV